ncbi:MAG: hypothetical protein B6245_14180 [Desulfobacteraceae bacterium 4572_88]|nr:MAG: hypothetical protein B6245_14180 [Desulfobacteraceae bacterium 4572_88]
MTTGPDPIKILLVDDEASFIQTISYGLSRMGFDIRSANSGPEALEIMCETVPNILVTDIQMPGMNGLELTKIVLQQHPDIVAIAMTGHGDMDLVVEFMRLGGADFLQKPLEFTSMKLAMDAAVGQWQLKQELKLANEALIQKNIELQREIQARAKSDKRNQRLFETHSATMLVIDPETGEIADANIAACNYYGYSKPDITRLNITDIDTSARDKVFEAMEQAWKQKKNFFCFRHRLADGKIRDVEMISVPTTVEDRQLLYATIRDVSRRIRAEKALQESEQRYRNIFENAPIGIYQVSLDGTLSHANPAFAEMLGYASPEEMRACISDDVSRLYVYPDKRGSVVDMIIRNSAWTRTEIEIYRKDESIATVKATVRPIQDEAGETVSLEGFIEDITEKKEREILFNLEMSRARKIYELVVKPHLPVMKGVVVNVKCLPAERVGGDVVDFFKLDEDSFLFFLADVTGHGIPAAMTANTLKMLFREMAETERNPAILCTQLNETMLKNILPDDTIVVLCGRIDLDTMTLTYSLCGIPSVYVMREQERIALTPTGLPLGIFAGMNYESKTLPLLKGDMLIAFTDGISECKSPDNKIFGLSGVKKNIRETPCDMHDLHDVLDDIVNGAIAFQEKKTFQDDVILMAIHLFHEDAVSPIRPWNRFCETSLCVFDVKTKYADIDEVVPFFINHIAEKLDITPEKLKKMRIALFEMLTNAVEHGNLEMTDFKKTDSVYESEAYWEMFKKRMRSEEYGERLIHIECLHDDGEQLRLSVKDDGAGFDVRNIPDPTHEQNLRETSGRGIAIARMSVDQVSYNAKGNKVTLVKDISDMIGGSS